MYVRRQIHLAEDEAIGVCSRDPLRTVPSSVEAALLGREAGALEPAERARGFPG
jgi:hypothetical protein